MFSPGYITVYAYDIQADHSSLHTMKKKKKIAVI